MKCSFRKRMGDKCWVRECIRNIFNEYGCAIRNDCTIKFRRVVHQVSNPLRTIESLMVKFCHVDNEGHQDKSDDRINENDYDTRKERILQVNKPHPSLMIYIKALFPHSTISEQTHKWDDYTCLQSIGHYVVLYNQILLDANKQQNRNLISDWYRIEDTSPCELMRLSGFMNDNDAVVVYPPNYDIVQSVCQDENNTDATTLPRRTSSSKKLKKMANEPFEQTDNLINLENIRLGWSDVRNNCNSVGGGRELEKKIKLLFRDLGYNTSQEND